MAKVTRVSPKGIHVALAILLLALPGLALAQAPTITPMVAVSLEQADLQMGAGNSTVVNGTVSNPGTLQGTVTLALTIPEGWTVQVEPDSAFSLAGGSSAPVTLTLVAPAAGQGAATGAVGLAATLTDQAGRTASADASVSVTRVDPVVIPPSPPPYGLYAAIAGAAVLLVAGGVFARVRHVKKREARLRAEEETRRLAHEAYLARETGIGIALVEGPLPYGTRRELVFRIAVENQSGRDRVAAIGVADCPSGWTAACAIPKMPLGPGEKLVVTFYVNPGDEVPGGQKANVAFFAKPEEAQELDQRVVLEVTAPEPRVPDGHARPATQPREAVAPRPRLRL